MLEIIGYVVKLIGTIVKMGLNAAAVKAEQKAAEKLSEKNLEQARLESEYKQEVAHEATRQALLRTMSAKIQTSQKPAEDYSAMYAFLFLLLLVAASSVVIYNKNRSNGDQNG